MLTDVEDFAERVIVITGMIVLLASLAILIYKYDHRLSWSILP
jgi:hypothetical protein